jgi:hypothetical protein
MSSPYMSFPYEDVLDHSLESILAYNPKAIAELSIPTIDYLPGLDFQVDIKGKILHESIVKNISAAHAEEFMQLFYCSVVRNGHLARSTYVYQSWLNLQGDSYLQSYIYPISLRPTANYTGTKRQNYADERTGSICAGYSLDGIPSFDDSSCSFHTPCTVSTGKIANTPVCWSYEFSACSSNFKLKHLFKLHVPVIGNASAHGNECYYIVLFTAYDYTAVGKQVLNFASDIAKGQTCVSEIQVQPLISHERPEVRNVLYTDIQSCLDVVVAHIPSGQPTQVFWKSGAGAFQYLDPISTTNHADGSVVLRVKLPYLERQTQVWIGVKAKNFDDLYSNIVAYNVPSCITPVKVYTAEPLIKTAQFPLQVYPQTVPSSSPLGSSSEVPCSPPASALVSSFGVPFSTQSSEYIPIAPLTPLQLLCLRGRTLACTYIIIDQISKFQVEDTFAVVSCAFFSTNMRTFIVCQSFHMWNMQLLPKDSLLDLLHLVTNHDHFAHPLSTAEMLCRLPKDLETEKHLATISMLFTEPYLQHTQLAYNQLSFAVLNSSNPPYVPTQISASTEIPRSSQTPRPLSSSMQLVPEIPFSPAPQTPQPLVPHTTLTSPSTQGYVSYQQIRDLLEQKLSLHHHELETSVHTKPQSVPSQCTPPLITLEPCSIFTSQIPPSNYAPSPMQTLAPRPIATHVPLLATSGQLYRTDDSEPLPKRTKMNYVPQNPSYASRKRQCIQRWKSQRTVYQDISAPHFTFEPPPVSNPVQQSCAPSLTLNTQSPSVVFALPPTQIQPDTTHIETRVCLTQVQTPTLPAQATELDVSSPEELPSPLPSPPSAPESPESSVPPYRPYQTRKQKRDSSSPPTSPSSPTTKAESAQHELKGKINNAKLATPDENKKLDKRLYKPKTPKDEDYEDEGEDDDEEYDEAPLLRKSRKYSPKCLTDKPKSCLCKICTDGLPSQYKKITW